jgi:hypothetical protein
MEVIESLTSAENNPEAHEQAGRKKENSNRPSQFAAYAPPSDKEDNSVKHENSQPAAQQGTGEKKTGAHLDIIA